MGFVLRGGFIFRKKKSAGDFFALFHVASTVLRNNITLVEKRCRAKCAPVHPLPRHAPQPGTPDRGSPALGRHRARLEQPGQAPKRPAVRLAPDRRGRSRASRRHPRGHQRQPHHRLGARLEGERRAVLIFIFMIMSFIYKLYHN